MAAAIGLAASTSDEWRYRPTETTTAPQEDLDMRMTTPLRFRPRRNNRPGKRIVGNASTFTRRNKPHAKRAKRRAVFGD